MDGPAIGRDHFGVAPGAARSEVTHSGGMSGTLQQQKKKIGQNGIAGCPDGLQLTRSFISAFMVGDGQFCARVVAGHSSQKHSRPLSGPPLIAEDPGRAGPSTELQYGARSTVKNAVSRVVVSARRTCTAVDLVGISRVLAKEIAEDSRRGLLGWPVVKGFGLLYAGADRRKHGEKVEDAQESRAEPSRSSHAHGDKDSE